MRASNTGIVFSAVLASGLGLAMGLPALAQESIGSKSQPLTTRSEIRNWTANGNRIPVCWLTPGFDREKQIVREAIAATWEWYANLQFTDWISCPTGIGIGGSATVQHIRIKIEPQGTANNGAGGWAEMGMGALRKAGESPSMLLTFNPDGSADRHRVEYVGVHEFGHTLGFAHEQDAPGNEGPGNCTDTVVKTGTEQEITHYDRDSVMNYCNRDGNNTGYLTDIDIQGVQQIYGIRNPNIRPRNACASAPLKTRSSLAAPWNDSGQATIAVFPSDGSRFTGWTQWVIRDGGWGDEVKWLSGDFTGDSKSDLGAIWNNGGVNVLTVRPSRDNKFGHEHWLQNGGGWMNASAWMAGDFNGDHKSDIAGAWNNGGQASIAVFLSDGSKFPGWTQWADRDGGWSDNVRWFAGDFNGDGRTDVGAAWNNDGRTVLTVRSSDGSKFSHTHWSIDSARWWDSAEFLVGDFDSDGEDDVAQVWNDMGKTSIRVWRSTGSQFTTPSLWSERDGGWGLSVRWISGDFNGDGRTDIGAAWNNSGHNTLTVRASTGSKFTHTHWLADAGGWIDSTAWCSGQF